MPQLNPEFFISQLFWLVISFTFLFIFLWKISLPRIGSVLEKRAIKIKENIKVAKQFQAEAEEIQTDIDHQLRNAKLETSALIKSANENLQEHSSKELEKLDGTLNSKLEQASSLIEKNRSESVSLINQQIFQITKLTLSKITNVKVNEGDINSIIKNIQKKVIN